MVPRVVTGGSLRGRDRSGDAYDSGEYGSLVEGDGQAARGVGEGWGSG